ECAAGLTSKMRERDKAPPTSVLGGPLPSNLSWGYRVWAHERLLAATRDRRGDASRLETARTAGSGRTPAFRHRPRKAKVRPIEASKAAICCVRNKSTPAVGSAQTAVIRRRRGERVKSIQSRGSPATPWTCV